jgi:hypothetical protein
MAYNINFTDTNNNDPLVVNDNTINTSTSLGFPGRNQKGYAVTIGENLLHLLENFSNTTAPPNPIKGQLWYDSNESGQSLMVYDGTNWKSSGSLKKGTNSPLGSNSILGDLWVDTGKQQLYLFNGSSWVLVGPTVSIGDNNKKTGSIAEIITDSTSAQTQHSVIKNYVDDVVVSIQSSSSFIPKVGIPGFSLINQGITLNSDSTKYWGISQKSESLIIGGNPIPAVSFLRSDISNITTGTFTIRNNSGLNLGDNSQLQVRVTDGKGVVYHSSAASRLDLRVNTGSETTLVSLDSASKNVGIGEGVSSFTETLTVKGSGSFTDPVKITDTTDSSDSSTGSLLLSGGAYIAKTLRTNGDIITNGQITSNSIIPAVHNLSNLGSYSYSFAKIFSTNFYGSLTGNVTGNVVGNVAGSASSLISSTTFSMVGDVSSAGFIFNGGSETISAGSFTIGQLYKISSTARLDPVTHAPINPTDFTLIGSANNDVGTIFKATGIGTGTGTAQNQIEKVFNTTISENFIKNRTATPLTANTDEIMIYRANAVGYVGSTGRSDPGVYKTSKSDFLSNLSLVPVGAIFPFAGNTVPSGYLLCDGSEKPQGRYKELFDLIGTTYTPNTNSLVGYNTFRLPDLRGRFPLGLLNMDNNDTVINNLDVHVDSGGGDPGSGSSARVTSSTAATLGNVAGAEQVSLDVSQLPEHQHKLMGNAGGQYYAINNDTQVPQDQDSESIRISGNNLGQALPNTGGVKSSTISQPVNVTNPYLTINYIIYSGVHS